MTTVQILDNSKYHNKNAEISLECKEGIIVSLQDVKEIKCWFGLRKKQIIETFDWFLFQSEFKIIPAVEKPLPDWMFDLYVPDPEEIETYIKNVSIKINETKEIDNDLNKITEVISKPSISPDEYSKIIKKYHSSVCQPSERTVKCPKCNKHTTINDCNMQLRCCKLPAEMLLVDKRHWA